MSLEKSFAVVAEEVRKLSSQSQEASTDIGELLDVIVSELNDILEKINHSEAIFKDQSEAVKSTESSFSALSEFLESFIEEVHKFFDQFQDMYGMKDELFDSINNIVAVSEESASTTQELASLSMLQKNSSQSIVDLLNFIRVKLDELSLIREENEIDSTDDVKTKVGLVFDVDVPFWDPCTEDAMSAAKKYHVDLKVSSPKELSKQNQLDIIHGLIDEGYNAIGICPCDGGEDFKKEINRIIDGGTKVVFIGSDIEGCKRSGAMLTDGYSAGKSGAQHVLEHYKDVKTYGIIRRKDGPENWLKREQGFVDTMNSNKDVTLVEFYIDFEMSLAQYKKAFETFLIQNPQVEVLYSTEGNVGEPLIQYWIDHNITKCKLLTFDNTEIVQKGISKGYVIGSVAQRPFIWGTKAINWLVKATQGKDVPDYEDTGTFIVTKENIDIF